MTLTLADEIKKYDTGALISFLQERDLRLDLDDENIIRKEKIDGRAFLKLGKEEFRSISLGLRPTEVLEKYDLASEGTEIIPLFTLRIHKISDENKYLELYMADIKL
ncbi:15041_t:CDS:2 [Funneliformis caledonium]|uniref:15041_t:CDS:1 n=1 Tax=Funneliformis caledonium TaxID=1117310 RepID=A0A9N9F7J2_9GLOM|nr:15041_t:CDS:2 [Funneliformis caledonium]